MHKAVETPVIIHQAVAQTTICAYGHFFADHEAASTWPGLHPEAVLLAVGDAARLAKALASVARSYVEKAER